jgi:hypothetical protein
MKYRKGEFVTVPNRSALHTLSVGAQALFMWICIYADEDGICFPSRSKLARNLNCAVRSVDAYLNELIEKGFITKTNRVFENEKKSSLYQIVILEGGGANSAPGGAKNNTTPGANIAHRTKTNITKYTISDDVASQEIIEVKDEPAKPRSSKPSPVAEKVFKLFSPKYPANWKLNKTQRQAATNLYEERGLEQIEKALEFYRENKDEQYCPTILTPYDLDSKWKKLAKFKRDHGN